MKEIKKQLLALLELVEKDEKAMLDIDAKSLPDVFNVIRKCGRDYVTLKLEVTIHHDGTHDCSWGIYDNKPKGMWNSAATLRGAFEAWKAHIGMEEEVDMAVVAGMIQPSIRHEILDTAAQITKEVPF
jgi:hypothetical protein